MEKRKTLLIDMYGVILEESKGNFIPYTLGHFETNEHERILHMLKEEQLFTKAGNGLLSADEFLRCLGYGNPKESMVDYLKNHLTLDSQFRSFAEQYSRKMDMVLLSNDVCEWSEFLTEYHGLNKYFKEKIVSGEIHMRKPEERIFAYTLQKIGRPAEDCIFVDNSSKNLLAAEKYGIHTILFNWDGETYDGTVVTDFEELGEILEKYL